MKSIQKMTTPELLKELDSLLTANAANVMRQASVISELRTRGVDTPSISAEYVRMLDKVQAGILLPDVICRFGFRLEVIRKISQLPLRDQAKLVSNPIVNIVRRAGKNKTSVSQEPIRNLGAAEISQVFGTNRLRTVAEQETIVAGKADPGSDARAWMSVTCKRAQELIIKEAARDCDMSVSSFIIAVLSGQIEPPLSTKRKIA